MGKLDVRKLKWCKDQKRGVKITEPNKNLAKEYIGNAEETLLILKDIEGKSNMWLATTKYYCEYFAVYSLLMLLGVRSEIHDCTIELCKILERIGLLPKGTSNRLERDKRLRIDNQYYLKNRKVKVDYNSLRDFILEIKFKIQDMSEEEILRFRKEIKKFFR